MTTNLSIHVEAIRAAWNSHDAQQVMRFYAPDYVGEDVGLAAPLRGLKGFAPSC